MGDIAGVTSMHIQGLTAEEGGGEKAKKNSVGRHGNMNASATA